MRTDLKQISLKDSLPLYPIDLATAAFIWQCRQFYDQGYLQYELNVQHLNSTGQYVHTGYFIKNQQNILDMWDYSKGREWFDYGLFVVEMNMVNDIRELDTVDEKIGNMFVKLYLSTFRRTVALGYHYASSPVFQYGNIKKFSRLKMLDALDFDVESENPFILMVDSLAKDHRWIAMFAAFMATAPNGMDFTPVDEQNAQMVYESAVPNSDIAKFHQILFNPIPSRDWIA